MANPTNGGVWVSRVDEYVLEHWTVDGRKLAHLTRNVPWFPPRMVLPPNANNGTHPPPPQVRSIALDTAGLIWVLSSVADRQWKARTLPPYPPVPGTTYTPDSLRHKINDSVLEIVDPVRGVIVATRTFDTLFMALIAPNLLVSFAEDGDGNPRYIIWRAQMVRATK